MVYAHSEHILKSKYTTDPPQIDGSIIEGEWSGQKLIIPTKTYLKKLDAVVEINAMNDEKFLYLKINVLPDASEYSIQSGARRLNGLYIDVNHDGLFSEGIDIRIHHNDSPLSSGSWQHILNVYRSKSFEHPHGIGWTGSSWIYETKIPFTLDNGYTWSKPGSTIGIGLSWMTWERSYTGCLGTCAVTLYNLQQIIVPPDSVYHWTQANIGPFTSYIFLTPVPDRFFDLELSSSGPELLSFSSFDNMEV